MAAKNWCRSVTLGPWTHKRVAVVGSQGRFHLKRGGFLYMGIKGTLVVSWFNIMCYTSKQVRLNLVFTDICKYTDISKYRDIILPTIPQCISLYIMISVNIMISDLVPLSHSVAFCLCTYLKNGTSLCHIMVTMKGKHC